MHGYLQLPEHHRPFEIEKWRGTAQEVASKAGGQMDLDGRLDIKQSCRKIDYGIDGFSEWLFFLDVGGDLLSPVENPVHLFAISSHIYPG